MDVDAHQRVIADIEIRAFAKHVHGDGNFLGRLSGQRRLEQIVKKPSYAGFAEHSARLNARGFGP
jgi:hypothetical protein